jgi:hypothetical protein
MASQGGACRTNQSDSWEDDIETFVLIALGCCSLIALQRIRHKRRCDALADEWERGNGLPLFIERHAEPEKPKKPPIDWILE